MEKLLTRARTEDVWRVTPTLIGVAADNHKCSVRSRTRFLSSRWRGEHKDDERGGESAACVPGPRLSPAAKHPIRTERRLPRRAAALPAPLSCVSSRIRFFFPQLV